MKKSLILFSVLFSLTGLANQDAERRGDNFVIKGFAAAHHKCQKARAEIEGYDAKVASWDAVKQDCLALDELMKVRSMKNPDIAVRNVFGEEEAAPVAASTEKMPEIVPEVVPEPALAADLPKTDL